MSDYEKYVVGLTKFKVGEYVDRQDYLASLVRYTDKWLQKYDEDGDIFDGWSDDLANWFGNAVRAMNAKIAIPDFPDMEMFEEDSVPEEVDDEEVGETVPGSSVTEVPIGPEPDEYEEAEEAVSDQAAEGNEVVEPVDTKSGATEDETPKPKYRGAVKTRYDNMNGSGARDRFGVFIGTKTHDAVVLYEKGTTAKELEEKVGGRHYNILKVLAKKGHRVLKQPGGGFKLIHKEDLE